MELSVIICTYNRFASLERTMDSFRKSFIPEKLEWELIIVDNGTGNSTSQLVETYRERSDLPIVYIREQQTGISHARNRGVFESKGNIVAFTDDDTIVDTKWIQNIIKAFSEYNVACVGGKILPIWEQPKPNWLSKNFYGYLALLDYGDSPFYLKYPDFFGANFAVQAKTFEKYGLFRTDRGRLPNKLYAGEDTHYFRILLENGENLLYIPDLIVHHHIQEKRMRKRYFRKWQYDQGELHGLILHDYSFWFAMKNLTYYTFFYLFSLFASDVDRLDCQIKMFHYLGFFMGKVKYMLRGKNIPIL